VGHLGDHIRAIRADFAQARRYAPAILFLDEIDSVGNRDQFSGDNAQYHVQVVNAILEQMKPLEKEGIEVEVVPGVSSLFAASAALKTQLTLKGVSESLIVTRPAGTTLERDELAALSRHGTTLAVFLGVDKIRDVMKSLDRPKIFRGRYLPRLLARPEGADWDTGKYCREGRGAGYQPQRPDPRGRRCEQDGFSEVSSIQKSVAVVVFPRDSESGEKICQALAEAEGYRPSLQLYEKEKVEDILKEFDILVMVMATGIVVRSICPYLKDKWTDKPVVAVDSSCMPFQLYDTTGKRPANDWQNGCSSIRP
jgi:hypothetical protein